MRCFYTTLFLIMTHCTTLEKLELQPGLQASYSGFVPARIAVAPCRLLPKAAFYKSLPLHNLLDPDLQKLCQKFDSEVIEAFTGQPFMNGFTPQKILKLLEASAQPDHLKNLDKIWQESASFCDDCKDILSAYNQKIAHTNSWQIWLTQFSQWTEYSDALLLPLVLYGQEKKWDDRGLLYGQRQAEIALLLIDTNKSSLIWMRNSFTQKVSQKLLSQNDSTPPEYPAWETLYPQLFVKYLWHDFPGRITP